MDREAQRDEVWGLLREEIQRGDAAGMEERRGWFVERLGGLESEACEVREAGGVGGSVERAYGGREVQKREVDEWWRAGREMALLAEEGLRLKRLEDQE